MRFPLSLTRAMTRYLLERKWAGDQRFPLVLMLEPLHACNLRCNGCGRIREYADSLDRRLTVEQCLDAADQCPAPVVSICGGEPLLYRPLPELISALIDRGRHIYLCTNGVLLERRLPELSRSRRLFINVHLDGMEHTHDAACGKPGVFAAATAGIRAAKAEGRFVCTNTTIYRETDMNEIVVLFAYLQSLGVEGMMISPAYGYASVAEQSATCGSAIFLDRAEMIAKFRAARKQLKGYRLLASPLYLDFLCGQRELTCAAWANPTFNTRGWRGPCYLIADEHHSTYADLLNRTRWSDYGPGADPRCADCMTHCGFEPAAVLSAGRRWRDVLAMAAWQLT